MKKVFITKEVKVNSIKGDIEFSNESGRFYFLAVAPAYFDKVTKTMYVSESVVIGDESKENLEVLYNALKNFFQSNPNEFATVQKREATYIDDDIAE